MSEPTSNPRPGPPGQTGTGGSVRAPQLRGAASSPSADGSVVWAWVVTAALIVAGGGTLYAARSAVGTAFDRWLPAPGGAREAPEEDLAETAPTPPPVAEDSGPEWTYADVEAAIAPLPEATLGLIEAGRGELSDFAGLSSSDETRALLIRNRWRLWGRIWHNRVTQIRGALPPLEGCLIHAALAPTCQALSDSLEQLDAVPSAERTDDAEVRFDEAFQILDLLLNPPEDELEDAEVDAEDAVDAEVVASDPA